MAPVVASVHKLVAQNARLAKALWKYTLRSVQNRLPDAAKTSRAQLQPVIAQSTPRQPIHPLAFLKQTRGRWYTTHSSINSAVRRFTSAANSAAGPKYPRSSFPKSKVGSAVSQLTGRTPFASTLRPNLTGGTLGRSAGGYSYGSGSARFFSHGPAAPAQVVQNVSQAMRAFLLSGKKAQFDGVNPRNGEMRFKAVTNLQKEVGNKMNQMPRVSPGSFIEFNINPTITALTPLSASAGFSHSAFEGETLSSNGLIDVLSVDFSRSLKELAAVLDCLKRLSAIGDLPISYHHDCLRVHFPGCDADTVERICDELGIYRGTVHQDEDFDDYVGTEMALLFPFAPSKSPSEHSFMAKSVTGRCVQQEEIIWQNMMSPDEDSISNLSALSNDGFHFEEVENPWVSSSPSGYESLHSSEAEDLMLYNNLSDDHTPLEYQGIEGIYRFMEQCGSSR